MENSPKYPRTHHFEWSPGQSNDDKVLKDISGLLNTRIVVTEKMDGSNVCMETRSCFARTHSGPPDHPSFDAFKQLHSMCRFKIPEGLQIFGEWCYALHSIAYDALPGYFLMFGARDLRDNKWLSWEEVELWAQELGVHTVPVLSVTEVPNELALRDLTESLCSKPSVYGLHREGVVVRIVGEFVNADFPKVVAKWVRSDHVQTDQHWKTQQIVRNKLKV